MKYYTDGFVFGRNPSWTGGGFTVFLEDKLLVREEIMRAGFTNNEAELLGVLYALRVCGIRDTVSTDSMNTLSWAHTGRSKARPDLAELAAECQRLIIDKDVNLMWERRGHNLAGIYNELKMTERQKDIKRKRKLNQALAGEAVINTSSYLDQHEVEQPTQKHLPEVQ